MLSSLHRILFPSRCSICGQRLGEGEEDVCTSCFFDLPIAENAHEASDEEVLKLFHELICIERAKSFLEYYPDNATAQLIMALKYGGKQHIGRRFGEIMANYWADCGFFEGIDLIVPIPLAKGRERQRGYNQSLLIAQGMRKVCGISINTTGLVRSISNPTQTSVAANERQKNVENIFTLLSPNDFAGRHVLLVDDIITTGATMKSAAKEIAKAGDLRFSFAALAKTNIIFK